MSWKLKEKGIKKALKERNEWSLVSNESEKSGKVKTKKYPFELETSMLCRPYTKQFGVVE